MKPSLWVGGSWSLSSKDARLPHTGMGKARKPRNHTCALPKGGILSPAMLPEEAVPVAGERVSFERERGVNAIVVSPEVAYLFVRARARPTPSRCASRILDMLTQAGLSISLIKLQRNGLSFAVPAEDLARTHQAPSERAPADYCEPRLRVISIYGQNMRELHRCAGEDCRDTQRSGRRD